VWLMSRLRHQMRREPPSKATPWTSIFPPRKSILSISALSGEPFRYIQIHQASNFGLHAVHVTDQILKSGNLLEPCPTSTVFPTLSRQLVFIRFSRPNFEWQTMAQHTMLQQIQLSNHCSGTLPPTIHGIGTAPRRSQQAGNVDPCIRALFGGLVLLVIVFIIGIAANSSTKDCYYAGNPPTLKCW
jgi:hypothetical protein